MKNEENKINIVYASDNNYAAHAAASIASLMENNKNLENVDIYIIENGINDENKKKLEEIAKKYKELSIKWIDFSVWEKRLNLNMEWNIAISAYARLFLTEMISENIDKILYLDCDIIVNGSITELWKYNIEKYYIGAVQDAVNDDTKNAVGVIHGRPYFNSGVLLINLKKWREDNISKRFYDFIDEHHGNVIHHDQGIINGVLKEKILKLPLQYNVMTIHYIFNRNQIMKYYKESGEFYDSKEIEVAKNNPIILHYTPSFTVRPWVKGCKHPKRDLYWKYLNKTPWKKLKIQKNNDKYYIRIINWMFRNFYR